MKKLTVTLLILALASGCSGKLVDTITQPEMTPTGSRASSITPAPLETDPTPTPEADIPTEVPDPTMTETVLPATSVDLSGVTLYQATFLMDPNFFQVSLENWPDLLPVEVVVSVGGEPYSCEELFPEDFPDRIYCFGPAPRKGEQISVVVTGQESDVPLLEIPFIVPAPGGGGDG